MDGSQGVGAVRILEAEDLPRARASLWRDAFRRLIRNKLAVIGGTCIILLALMAIFAPYIAPYSYDFPNYDHTYEAPTREYPMGTDHLGRDMLSRMIYGARVSMTVGLVAQLLVLLIGVPIGAIAAYFGGKVDAILMRFVDAMYAFPQLLFVILIMSMLGAGIYNIFIAIGLTGWVTMSRLTRGQMLSLKEKEYVKAARTMGGGSFWIIVGHLLPNSLTPIIVSLTFGIPQAIFTEAALSFIGVGINPPTPSWGQMVGQFAPYIRSYWWLSAFPSAAIAITMLSFTFLGDGLRDALDPHMNE